MLPRAVSSNSVHGTDPAFTLYPLTPLLLPPAPNPPALRGTWSRLSADHRIASSQAERDRLAARGHTVRTRLYGLNISRMLGDRWEGGEVGVGALGRWEG